MTPKKILKGVDGFLVRLLFYLIPQPLRYEYGGFGAFRKNVDW
jgi:hypothetical protein